MHRGETSENQQRPEAEPAGQQHVSIEPGHFKQTVCHGTREHVPHSITQLLSTRLCGTWANVPPCYRLYLSNRSYITLQYQRGDPRQMQVALAKLAIFVYITMD